jgi:aminoacrylate hydrolase
VIAQVVASKHPHRVASVVLGGTWLTPDERFRRVFELRRDVLSALGTDAYALLGSILIAPPDETLNAAKPEPTDPGIIEARIEVLLDYQGVEHLRQIRCQALVVAAADDVLIPVRMSRAVAAGIAGADLKILPEGGHGFPRSRPTDYNRIVREFLSNHAPRPSMPQTDTPSVTARGEGVRL